MKSVPRCSKPFWHVPGFWSIAITFLGTRLSIMQLGSWRLSHRGQIQTSIRLTRLFWQCVANMVLFLCMFFRELGWIKTCLLANTFGTRFETGPKPIAPSSRGKSRIAIRTHARNTWSAFFSATMCKHRWSIRTPQCWIIFAPSPKALQSGVSASNLVLSSFSHQVWSVNEKPIISIKRLH